MKLKVGDHVVHPAFGIGHIAEIEEKSFSQRKIHSYYKVVHFSRTMWIQVGAQEASGLRLVTAKSDLDHYRHLLKSPAVSLNTNLQQRQLDLLSCLTQGSFQGVCEVVRDLTAWSLSETLDRSDMTVLQKARDTLTQEWATAAEVSPFEAVKEIDSLLLATQHA